MKNNLTKEDFEVFYEIEFLNINSIKNLIGRIGDDEMEVKEKLNALEKKGLIVSDKYNLYKLTEKGKKIWNDSKNNKLKVSMGY